MCIVPSLELVSSMPPLYGLPCLQHYLTILSSALRIIYPELSYMDALAVTDLDTLVNPRHDCCMKFVSKLRECKSLNFNPLVSIVKEVSYEPAHQYNLRIKEYRMIFRAGKHHPCTRDVARPSECIISTSRRLVFFTLSESRSTSRVHG